STPTCADARTFALRSYERVTRPRRARRPGADARWRHVARQRVSAAGGPLAGPPDTPAVWQGPSARWHRAGPRPDGQAPVCRRCAGHARSFHVRGRVAAIRSRGGRWCRHHRLGSRPAILGWTGRHVRPVLLRLYAMVGRTEAAARVEGHGADGYLVGSAERLR